MNIGEITQTIEGKVLCCEDKLGTEVVTCCASDMMSDVLAFYSASNGVLITGLVNPQIVRTAIMVDAACIIIARDKKVDDTIINLAKDNGIVIILSPYTMFETSGRLYEAGLRKSKG